MFKVGIGQAEGLDTERVVSKVIRRCQEGMDGMAPRAGIVFTSGEFDHDRMLEEIHGHFPGMDLIGCTTAGEFSSGFGFSEDAILLLTLGSDTVEMRAGIGADLSKNPEAAVEAALKQAGTEMAGPPRLCLTFPDLFNKPGASILETLSRNLGPKCTVFGGCAARPDGGDHPIHLFFNGRVLTDALPLLLFAGPLEQRFALANSWKPIGMRAEVTRAEGRRIYSIGDQNALDFYRRYLGVHGEPATAFPLAVHEPDAETFYLREPLVYDDRDGSVLMTEAVPEGSTVQITEPIRDYILDHTRRSLAALSQQPDGAAPAFGLAFSCVIRKEALGTRIEEEMHLLRDALPRDVPVLGFYGFGEIGPLGPAHPCFLHNASLLVLQVGESPAASSERFRKPETDRPLPSPPTPKEESGIDQLRRERAFLIKRLARSERYRRRLEDVKELNAAIYRNIVRENKAAQKAIQEKEAALKKSRKRYRRIVETAAEGYFFMDENLVIQDANQAFREMVGYSEKEVLGKSILDLATDGYREFLLSCKENPFALEYDSSEGIFATGDGRKIPVLVHGSTLRDEDDRFMGHAAFVTDLSELITLQRDLLASEIRFRGMYENALQGMFQTTLTGKILNVNPAYARMLGYDSPHQLMTQVDSVRRFYEHPEDRERMVTALREQGRLTDYELRLKRKDGEPVWNLINVHLIEQKDGDGIIEGLAIDNTARKQAEDELRKSREMFRHLAIHDSLTGLYNTRHLYRALEDLIVESRAGDTPFSLIFMDMDNFKRVVDTYGHLNGSQVLKEVAETIAACLTEPAFGVAYGGDEFVIVLPGRDKDQAREKAEEIRRRMKETVYLSSRGHAVHLHASFGIAAFPEDASDLSAILALADQAMFHVKEKGKDAIGVGSESS
ncbi:MAG: diguanylate cyclase [Thermodesulfobacteriota bacterium]